MPKLTKRTGTHEEFSPTKLEESLRRAGASQTEASDIATRLKPTEGETTEAFRKRVANELRQKNANAAHKYETTRRLETQQNDQVSKGRAQIHPDTLRHYGLKAQDKVTAEHQGKTLELQLEEGAQARHREVRMHPDTAKQLGAANQARVALRRE